MDIETSVETLLEKVKIKVDHSRELAKLKGERFNIFSLLNMESSENITHSRFLGELLNPKGTHNLRHTLLEQFIRVVNKDLNIAILEKFECSSAIVTLEKFIGKRDDVLKQGGRVDIAISDKNGYSIFIENKIYASDQNAQIERYCNYSKDKCVVIYLTRGGHEASQASKGLLIAGTDYFCISYKNDIISWLDNCIKEAAEQPILRETIRQYNNLIKKLTGQLMSHQMNKQVKDLILNNLESAEIIAKNFNSAKEDLLSKIRNGLKRKLEESLDFSAHYIVKDHGKIGDRNSKLWFYHRDFTTIGIYFGIEPFSGNGVSRNELFIGIIDLDSKHLEIFKNDNSNLDIVGWWRGVDYLTYKGDRIILSNLKVLKELNKEENIVELINELFIQTLEYIKQNEETLLRIYRTTQSVKAT